MRSTDLPQLQARLNELADYYDKRHPSAGALKIWLDAIGECQIDDVLSVLVDWPRTHRQMPMADEVLKLSRDRLSDRIERRSAQEKDQWRGASISRVLRSQQSTEIAREQVSMIRRILAAPKAGPMEWASRILRGDRPKASAYAHDVARRVASEACEPDLEMRLEREAIQADGA